MSPVGAGLLAAAATFAALNLALWLSQHGAGPLEYLQVVVMFLAVLMFVKERRL